MITFDFLGETFEFNLSAKPLHIGRFSKTYVVKKSTVKLLIKYASNNIPPFEVERFIRQHDLWNRLYPQYPSSLIHLDYGYIFVRKFLEGSNFMELGRKAPKISLLKQAFTEIKQLHSLGYLCTDIKPSNFLTTPDQTVLLIDLGSCIPYPNFVQSGYVIPFTFLYAPPEMILNRYDLCNETSDYYMWAMMAFHVVTVKTPFDHCNPVILMHQQLNTFPNYDLIKDEELQSMIKRMTYKELFPMPPNKMTKTEKEEILMRSIQKRIELLKEINI